MRSMDGSNDLTVEPRHFIVAGLSVTAQSEPTLFSK